MVEEIKDILYNDKDALIMILENLGCHKINPYNNREIRCALPDGTNGTSVQIILNEFLPTYVHSRTKYDKYEIKDIISFVQFILDTNFTSVVIWLCNELGIKYDENRVVARERSETLMCLKRYTQSSKQEYKNNIMDEDFLNQYPPYIVNEWVQEGISAKTQKKYDIRIDNKRSRWLIPIRDESGDLVIIKGRTYLPNYRELGVPKYIYYKDSNKKYYNNVLFGLSYHKDNIKKQNEIIIFEGEKSVMKAEDMGFDNCVSIGGNSINNHLLPQILKQQVDVVLALDKGIPKRDIINECKKLSMFTNVYYIYDEDNLLDKNSKDAPVDKGLGVWLELYNNKKRCL